MNPGQLIALGFLLPLQMMEQIDTRLRLSASPSLNTLA